MSQFRVFFVIVLSFTVIPYDHAQIVNLALNKDANSTVSVYYGDQLPALAVDGDLSQSFSRCAHTAFSNKQTVAWWQVDLTEITEIINITIFYRKKTVRRLNGFQITTDMDGIWQNKTPCYSDSEPGDPSDVFTVHTCTGPGRFVTIFNYQYHSEDSVYGPILELCEVQIFGCSANKYGYDCKSNCHCKQRGCFSKNGTCFVPGCEKGWWGSSCNRICNLNEFGPDCTLICHCQIGSCNRFTGVCATRGCKPGWTGLTCSTPCNTYENKFGLDCASTCNCLDGSCDHETGICNKPGCKLGWMGDNCSIQCGENQFGPDCRYTCHCVKGSCSSDSGKCFIQGCKAGWLTDTCSQPCVSNTFGFECNATCSCKEGSCNNINGQCFIAGCQLGWIGESCSTYDFLSISQTVGISVGVPCFIFVALLITIYTCRRRRKSRNDKIVQVAKPDDMENHVYEELHSIENTDLSQYSEINQTDSIKDTTNKGSSSSTDIRIENIKNEVSEKIKNGLLLKQHETLPYGRLYQHTSASLMKNKKKNRNQNVLPYDHSRVVLDNTGKNTVADYINASYIYGKTKHVKYIATQAPLENTRQDFWSMVWQTNCKVILMLTNIKEKKQVVCCQYWPGPSKALFFLEYEIVLLKRRIGPEFILRILRLKNTKTGEVRKIWHLQFISWPNEGVPKPYQLLLLHKKYVEISTNHPGIPIIHCSDGTDRTGVFIAFDVMSEYCYRNETINMFEYIKEMRKSRMDMVNSKESYVLVHELLVEQVQYQSTSFSKDLLCAMPENDKRKDKEYEMLLATPPEYGDTMYKKAMLKKNRGRNRNQSILPVEIYRIILDTGGKNSYINAVGIPSCKVPKQFLVTQMPLRRTVVDLWRMVNGYKAYTIVCLEETQKNEKDLVWYPTDEGLITFDKLTLKKISEQIPIQGTKEITLKISNKDNGNGNLVKVFEYLNWKQGIVSPKPQTSFLDLIHLVQTWNKSISNGPITVICSDGAKCCGLFCLVYSIIENLRYRDEIDIYQMAKLQQIRRPQFFTDEQYHFCYNIVKEYVEQSELYKEIE